MSATIKTGKYSYWLAGIFSLCVIAALSSFVVTAQAAATTQPLQTPSNPYADADVLLSSVLDHMQYPLPQNVATSAGNHLVFTSPKIDTAHPTSDQVRYIAAYRYCEHLIPVFPSPTFNTKNPTLADMQSFYSDRNESALKSAAMEECFKAMSERTSCPSASASSFTLAGQSQNCFTMQKTMCHFLKDKPPAGLGIDGIGDQEADWALQNCDTDGLSPFMYDKISAHRCDNAAYMQNLATVLDSAAEVEKASQFECNALRDAFDAKLDRERERMLIATQTVVQLRSMGGSASVSPTSRPTGTGATGQ
jgi:hypothetical protein